MALHRGPVREGRKGDRVYTPTWCAADMVSHFKPSGMILEPCQGDGAIYNLLPPNSEWCEIDEGKNFFDYHTKVDWIISNPPYSKLRPFMVHAFRISVNVVLLIPVRNLVSGYGTVREAMSFGAMKEIRWYGGGARLGFPMGNAIAAVYWQKNYWGPTTQSFYEDRWRETHGIDCKDPQLEECLCGAVSPRGTLDGFVPRRQTAGGGREVAEKVSELATLFDTK